MRCQRSVVRADSFLSFRLSPLAVDHLVRRWGPPLFGFPAFYFASASPFNLVLDLIDGCSALQP